MQLWFDGVNMNFQSSRPQQQIHRSYLIRTLFQSLQLMLSAPFDDDPQEGMKTFPAVALLWVSLLSNCWITDEVFLKNTSKSSQNNKPNCSKASLGKQIKNSLLFFENKFLIFNFQKTLPNLLKKQILLVYWCTFFLTVLRIP